MLGVTTPSVWNGTAVDLLLFAHLWQDASTCVEKDDLIDRVVEIARAEAQKTANPPTGYSLDAASGYYYSATSGDENDLV